MSVLSQFITVDDPDPVRTLINQVTIGSPVASIEWADLNPALFSKFEVEFDGIAFTGGQTLLLQFGAAGPTWRTSGYLGSTSWGSSTENRTDGIVLSGLSNGSNVAAQGIANVYSAAPTSSQTYVNAFGTNTNPSTPYFQSVGRFDTAQSHNALRLISTSGNLTAGTARLYGVL